MSIFVWLVTRPEQNVAAQSCGGSSVVSVPCPPGGGGEKERKPTKTPLPPTATSTPAETPTSTPAPFGALVPLTGGSEDAGAAPSAGNPNQPGGIHILFMREHNRLLLGGGIFLLLLASFFIWFFGRQIKGIVIEGGKPGTGASELGIIDDNKLGDSAITINFAKVDVHYHPANSTGDNAMGDNVLGDNSLGGPDTSPGSDLELKQ